MAKHFSLLFIKSENISLIYPNNQIKTTMENIFPQLPSTSNYLPYYITL